MTTTKPNHARQRGIIVSVPPPPRQDPVHDVTGDSSHAELQEAVIPPKKKPIFDNELVTQLCIQYKQNEDFVTYKNICAATNDLIDSIIRVHKFHLSVPFEDLKNALFLQLRQWIRGVKIGPPPTPKVFTYFGSCFSGDTRVLAADGRWITLREIVENRLPTVLMSYNADTGAMEPKPVIGWFKFPVPLHARKSHWLQLVCEKAGTQSVSVFVTRDHEFLTESHGYVRTDQLTLGMHRLLVRRQRLTVIGQQAIIGQYMGDGNVTPRGLFRVSHCFKQMGYSEYVATALGAKVRKRRAYPNQCTYSKPNAESYWYTCCLQRLWPDRRHLPSRKRITGDLLEQIGPIALAYWFMDDGFCVKKHGGAAPRTVGLCTHGFTFYENELIREWIEQRYDVTFKVGKTTKKVKKKVAGEWVYTGKVKTYWMLRCTTAEDMWRFLEIVAPYIVPCMQYKLPVRLRHDGCATDGHPFIDDVTVPTAKWRVVPLGDGSARRMGKKGGKNTRLSVDLSNKYDVTVADNHNLYPEGVVAAQCIKHACLSYITKEKQLHSRIMFEHVHQTPLDAFKGMSYTPNFDFELRQSMLESVRALEVRWNEPVVREIIKYMVGSVMSNRATPRRQQIVSTTTLAYPVDIDTAKFLLDWTMAAVRACLLEQYNQPLGEIDMLRAAEKFSFIPDVINVIGLDATKRLMTVFAGMSLRFPSHTQARKISTARAIFEAIEKEPGSETVERLAGRLRMSREKVEETYASVAGNISDGVLQDSPLYRADDTQPDELMSEAFDT
jgi:hypothetical protein